MGRDVLYSASLGSPLFDFRDEIFQSHSGVDLPPILRVVSRARGKLIDESDGVCYPELAVEEADRLLVDFSERLQWECHSPSSTISSRGETALVFSIIRFLALRSSLSSQVQKKSAPASTADARCRASNGGIPESCSFSALSSTASVASI